MTTTLDIPRRPRRPAGPATPTMRPRIRADPSRERLASPATVVTFVRTLGAVVLAAATQASQTVAGGRAPQELAVAQLVCSGRTDREVATELVLSARTVSYHLGNAYTKLDVHSRTQLQAAPQGARCVTGDGGSGTQAFTRGAQHPRRHSLKFRDAAP